VDGQRQSSASWDTVATNLVWDASGPTYYANGDTVVFDDTATGTTNVDLNEAVTPTA